MATVIDNKYELVRLLGQGGMGAVHEARHLGTGRRVAVKVISGEALQKNEEIVARFQREARAAGAIESQHIAHVLDLGVDAVTGHPYMVMEFLSGEDVHGVIERLGPLAPDLALRVVAQACVGLQKAHEAGVVHRDIKPANLFLARQDGGDVVVKLLDFGIAKIKMEALSTAENAALTRTGSMLGSPLYMSPEQAKGAKNVDARTDLWSLGIVLYEALTGMTPFGHCDTLGGLILAICSEPPRLVQEHAPWVAPEIAAIVHRALMQDRDARFQSAAEMLAAIRAQLPNGHALNESMLVPLPPAVRSVVAPKLATTLRNPNANAGPASAPIARGGRVAHASTTGGIATTSADAPVPRAKSRLPIAVAAVVLASAAIFGVYRMSATHAPAQQAAATPSVATSAAALPPVPSPAPLASSAPPVATTRTVKLAITPPTASAEIDGASAPVDGGKVDVTGALGSTHHVRVFLAGKETRVDVVIAESGPVPPSIDLGVKAPAPAIKPGAVPAPAKPPANNGAVDRDFK